MTKYLSILLLLSSCSSLKIPTADAPSGKGSFFYGIPITCKTDLSFLSDSIVLIKRDRFRPHSYNNPNCSNRPIYANFLEYWPAMFLLSFNTFGKADYIIFYSPTPADSTLNKFDERGFDTDYKTDGGKVIINKRKSTITLISEDFDFRRKYKYSYSYQDSILTLR